MNPTIKKLLDNATEDILGVPQVNQEKFAKLIAEECANLCLELRFTEEGPSAAAEYQRTLCGMTIKEAFGLISKGPITALNINDKN